MEYESDPLNTGVCSIQVPFNPLNAELNPISHLVALLGGATIVVVSRLRSNIDFNVFETIICV